MDDNKSLESIREILREELKPVRDDLAELKEEAKVTRHSVNLLLRWAEKADRAVNVGLFDQN